MGASNGQNRDDIGKDYNRTMAAAYSGKKGYMGRVCHRIVSSDGNRSQSPRGRIVAARLVLPLAIRHSKRLLLKALLSFALTVDANDPVDACECVGDGMRASSSMLALDRFRPRRPIPSEEESRGDDARLLFV